MRTNGVRTQDWFLDFRYFDDSKKIALSFFVVEMILINPRSIT
jgi:hypothetical protein